MGHVKIQVRKAATVICLREKKNPGGGDANNNRGSSPPQTTLLKSELLGKGGPGGTNDGQGPVSALFGKHEQATFESGWEVLYRNSES